METRIRRYLKDYELMRKDRLYQFHVQCNTNKVKGVFAKMAYNLLKAKKQKESMSDDEIVEYFIEQGHDELMKVSKKNKGFLSTIREQKTTKSRSVRQINNTNKMILEAMAPLELAMSKKRAKSLTKMNTLKRKELINENALLRKKILLIDPK